VRGHFQELSPQPPATACCSLQASWTGPVDDVAPRYWCVQRHRGSAFGSGRRGGNRLARLTSHSLPKRFVAARSEQSARGGDESRLLSSVRCGPGRRWPHVAVSGAMGKGAKALGGRSWRETALEAQIPGRTRGVTRALLLTSPHSPRVKQGISLSAGTRSSRCFYRFKFFFVFGNLLAG
jgi:hypothetical protein